MKYGMNLLLWSGEVTEEMLPVCEQLKGIGYDSVELPMFNLDLDYAKIGKRLDEIGLGEPLSRFVAKKTTRFRATPRCEPRASS